MLYNLTGISDIPTLLTYVQSVSPYAELITLAVFLTLLIGGLMRNYNIKIVLPGAMFAAFTISTGFLLVGMLNQQIVTAILILLILSISLLFF